MDLMRSLFIMAFLLLLGMNISAQSILNRNISVNAENQQLTDVLKLVAAKGNFQFSYKSNSLPADSVVSIHTNDLSVEGTLNILLNNQFEYKEAGNFLILRYAPRQLSLLLQESSGNQDQYQITGRIIDSGTKMPVKNASIYEKSLLQSVLSNDQGYFNIKFKSVSTGIALTISKELYKDLTAGFLPEIIVRPGRNKNDATGQNYVSGDLTEVERTWLGRLP
jgi:hypothetical protein